MRVALFVGLLAFSQAEEGEWASLASGLEAWSDLNFDVDFSVSVGDENGTRFKWASPGFSTSSSRLQGASLSKWPAAIMLSGLVRDGTMSYDDPANKYLPFWTKQWNDTRAAVTLGHLLSFTSGFTSEGLAMPGCKSYLRCAEQLYNAAPHQSPGVTWTYLGIHLQLAGAMAVAASGKDIQTLFHEYLYKPYGMVNTSWSGGAEVPSMAAGIVTTADDFEALLHRTLTFAVLPPRVLGAMESDYSAATTPSGDGWFGHYAMGHWWECIGYGDVDERALLPPSCTDARIQAGPGLFGFYPLIDRSGGGGDAGPARPPMYFQVALQEQFTTSGIPEYLRLLAKPVADLILAGQDPQKAARAGLLAQGGGLLRRDVEDIASALKRCSCTRANGSAEPFATLSRTLAPDDPAIDRREYASLGQGLLLRDLADLQRREIGKCTCKGRTTS